MAYERKPIGKDEPLKPGRTYELVLTHKGGDLSRVTRSALERALQRQYGPGVRVLDWGRRGGDLVIRLKVEAATQNTAAPLPGGGCGSIRCPQPMAHEGEGFIYPAFIPALPAILSAAAVVAILYLVWRILAELKEAVELVPAPARGIAVAGAGIGAGALGLAALGVVALALMGGKRRYRYA